LHQAGFIAGFKDIKVEEKMEEKDKS